MRADYRLVFRGTGGPEMIEREAIDPPEPAAGEARVRHRAIGLNFIDTYFRSGLYPAAALPSGLGTEAAGIVEAVGAGVEHLAPGDRVAYFDGPLGAYATVRALPADRLIALPASIDDEVAAAAVLKGLTAWMLIEPCGRVEAGQDVLVHAAAGGVGSLLVPWLKAVGARVIAHAGSADKAARARALGADDALCCPFEALAEEVRALTRGRGVQLVLDGVGQASWDASLGSVAQLGLIASYGNASGAVPPVSPLALGRAGSVSLVRPRVGDYMPDRAARAAAAARLFAMIDSGAVPVEIGQRFPLADAVDAHRALEGRATTGSTVLLP